MLALWLSLVVVRVLAPDRRWSKALALFGFGAVTASLTWVAVSAVWGARVGPGGTWLWAGIGFAISVSAALVVTGRRR